MYCGNCGEEIPDGAMYCKNCGWQVSDTKIKVKRKNPLKYIVILIAGVILLLLLFSAVLNSSDTEYVDISLENVTSAGGAYYSNTNADEVYNYTLKGDFKDVPSYPDDFTVKGVFFDENHDNVGVYENSLEKSLNGDVVSVQTDYLINITQIQVTVQDNYGEVFFNHTYDYDMSGFDLSELDGDKYSSVYSFDDDSDFDFKFT